MSYLLILSVFFLHYTSNCTEWVSFTYKIIALLRSYIEELYCSILCQKIQQCSMLTERKIYQINNVLIVRAAFVCCDFHKLNTCELIQSFLNPIQKWSVMMMIIWWWPFVVLSSGQVFSLYQKKGACSPIVLSLYWNLYFYVVYIMKEFKCSLGWVLLF